MTKEEVLALFAAYDEFRKKPMPAKGEARTEWFKEYGDFQTKLALAFVEAPTIRHAPPDIKGRYVEAKQVSE